MARRDVDYDRDVVAERDVVADRGVVADRDVVVDRDVVGTRDVVVEPTGAWRSLRWGPIVAGLLTAISAFLLLSLLALAVGLQVVDAGDEAGADLAARLIGAAIALVSFFLGGFVAAWSAGVTDPTRGFLNGFLVWALWLVAVLVAGALGVGQLFGAAGTLLTDIRAPELSRQEAFEILRTGALQSFLALALTAVAAALGGVVGTRDEVRTRIGTY